jgi:hypothetical protein
MINKKFKFDVTVRVTNGSKKKSGSSFQSSETWSH